MKKLIFGLMAIFAVLFLSVGFVKAADLSQTNTQALSAKLKTECYDQFSDDLANAKNTVVTEEADIEAVTPDEVEAARQKYKDWVQTKLDLYACYKQQLTDYPDLTSKVDTLVKTADDEMAVITDFDFQKLLSPNKTASPIMTIPANSTKTARIRTFCMDTGRGMPSTAEEYYLAGSVDDLNRQGVCSILAQAADPSKMSDVQSEVWETQKHPTEISDLQGNTAKPSPLKAIGLTVVGLVLAIIFIVLNFKFKNLRIIWAIAIVASLILAGFGVWQLKKIYLNKTAVTNSNIKGFKPVKTTTGKDSLVDAARSNQVAISVRSTGSINEMDLAVTNRTSKELQLDTHCTYFIPQIAGNNESAYLPSWLDGIVDKALAVNKVIQPNNNKYDSSKFNSESNLGAQKMGSAGITAEAPLMPTDAENPTDFLSDKAQMIAQKLALDLAAFKANPNEDTLRNVLKDIQNCQLTGCGADEAAQGEIQSTWQDRLDQETASYRENPTEAGRDNLYRDAEIGQMLGCNADGALNALGLQN